MCQHYWSRDDTGAQQHRPFEVWSLHGGGVKTLPFCVGTAYNVSSVEDIGNSWSLCWQWKHTSQNYFHLSFCFELWHLCKSLLPSAKGLSFTFMQESVVFLLIPTYSLVGKHHVTGKDLSIYSHSNIFDHELLLLTTISMINKLGGKTLSPYLSLCLMDAICSKNMLWVLAIMEDYMIVEYVGFANSKLLHRPFLKIRWIAIVWWLRT